MTDEELNELKYKAEAASPGRWVCDSLNNVSNGRWNVVYATKTSGVLTPSSEDAAYIAAVNPEVIRELVEQLKASRKLIDVLTKASERSYFDHDKYAKICEDTLALRIKAGV